MRRMSRHRTTSSQIVKVMGDYLNLKGPDGAMPDIESSTHIEVAMHGNETEDVGILRTPEPLQRMSLSRLLLWRCLLLRFFLQLKLMLPNIPPLGMSLFELSKMR